MTTLTFEQEYSDILTKDLYDEEFAKSGSVYTGDDFGNDFIEGPEAGCVSELLLGAAVLGTGWVLWESIFKPDRLIEEPKQDTSSLLGVIKKRFNSGYTAIWIFIKDPDNHRYYMVSTCGKYKDLKTYRRLFATYCSYLDHGFTEDKSGEYDHLRYPIDTAYA